MMYEWLFFWESSSGDARFSFVFFLAFVISFTPKRYSYQNVHDTHKWRLFDPQSQSIGVGFYGRVGARRDFNRISFAESCIAEKMTQAKLILIASLTINGWRGKAKQKTTSKLWKQRCRNAFINLTQTMHTAPTALLVAFLRSNTGARTHNKWFIAYEKIFDAYILFSFM